MNEIQLKDCLDVLMICKGRHSSEYTASEALMQYHAQWAGIPREMVNAEKTCSWLKNRILGNLWQQRQYEQLLEYILNGGEYPHGFANLTPEKILHKIVVINLEMKVIDENGNQRWDLSPYKDGIVI